MLRNRFAYRKLPGFTLIELVIAVALLAILTAVAVTAFQNIAEKAKIAQCRAILKSARSAMLMHRAQNELSNSTADKWGHPRINSWPTFEEVRIAQYADRLDDSVFSSPLPQNPFKTISRPPGGFTNTFQADTSTDAYYDNPDPQGENPARSRVWCGNKTRPYECGDPTCPTGWFYDPGTGEFWADSSAHGSNNW